ncbi:MAG: response regulator transcription factor [Saprospiraceae bacterium]|jgi:two-component system alkaline phosphatase synthesis response regulator PhoP|nr:response regulator transcription factor [Saprospiraceae bacterium]
MVTKILVVDDEEDIREILRYNLTMEGFTVECAQNGKQCLQLMQTYTPDLVILDIMMPEINGIEVCRQIKRNPSYSDTKIVFLTARSEDLTQIQALDNGGDDFIAKPVKPIVLISKIKAILRRSKVGNESLSSSISVFGDLIIDGEKHLVTKDGKAIDLAKKEFQLLGLLVSRPGKVFTREEILRQIWGHDVLVGNRTIDVHVRKIREKVGEECIRTIKGIGYKFEI